jgi:hypothetical protein
VARRTKTEDTGSGMPEFEGKPVAASGIRITRAGDGLSEAMNLDPTELPHGAEVYIVLKGEVARVSHDPIPKTDGLLQRVHVVRATEAALVSHEDVKDLLEREQERVALLREEKAGVTRLPMGEDPLGVFDREGDPDE